MYKKISLLASFSILFLTSCGGDVTSPKSAENKPVQIVSKSIEKEAQASANHFEGLQLYNKKCKVCHQGSGLGYPNTFPPLAKSDFLLNKEATIKQILDGASGEMVVNGVTYTGVMQPFNQLSDKEIVQLLDFVYNSWGNTPVEITENQVSSLR